MNQPSSTYARISNFGSNLQSTSGNSDPLTYCLVDSMDQKFQHGSIGNMYGPASKKCQRFMAERCAKNWDGFCEYFYQEHGKGSKWPIQREYPNTFQSREWAKGMGGIPLTTGEHLLQNVAELRFCEYGDACIKQCEPFDPTNPNSPIITYYTAPNGDGCIPVCRVNPQTIDSDHVMDHMLQNPRAASTTLINICNTAKNENLNLAGTKIGAFCDRYHALRAMQNSASQP